MQNARIFLVDDSSSDREYVRKAMEAAGHQVVIEATTLSEALGLITSPEQLIQVRADLAILDGNLGTSSRYPFDGQEVAQAIRGSGLSIKIVAYTSFWNREADYGDAYVNKAGSKEELVSAVASL